MANPTLTDLSNQANGGDILPVIDIISKKNDLFASARWVEANGSAAHVYSVTSALPSGNWRGLNEGVDPAKGTPSKKTVDIANYNLLSTVDSKYLEMARDRAQARWNQDTMNLNGLVRGFAGGFITGTGANNQIKGLNKFCDGTDGLLFDGGNDDSGDEHTSIYVVQWSSDNVYFAYPQFLETPVEVKDLGETLTLDSSSKQYLAYVTEFNVSAGLAVENPDKIARVANVDLANIGTAVDKLIDAIYATGDADLPCDIYMNDTVMAAFAKNAYDKSNIQFTPDQFGGVQVPMFHGRHPMRSLNAISNTQSLVDV